MKGLIKRCYRAVVKPFQNPGSLTLGSAVVKHLIEAVILLQSGGAADGSMGIAAMLQAIPHGLPPDLSLAFILLMCVILTIWSMYDEKIDHRLAAAMLLPQQIMLGCTFLGAVYSAWVGWYMDLTPRPHSFILADQLPRILLATAYVFALFQRARWYGGKTGRHI